jgi:excisionase family DNA binding protein
MESHLAQPVREEPMPKLLTMADVEHVLGVSRMGAYRLIDAGELPVIRIGTRLRFDQADVAALIARGRSSQAPADLSGQHA